MYFDDGNSNLVAEFKQWGENELVDVFISETNPAYIANGTNQDTPERELLFSEVLQQVEKHDFFKVMMKNHYFKEAIRWSGTSKAPKSYQSAEGKVLLIRSVMYAIWSQHDKDYKTQQDAKNIQKVIQLAEQMQTLIEKSDVFMDDQLFRLCNSIRNQLDSISQYKSSKSPRQDDTQNERKFLYDLITAITILHSLPVSVGFIERLYPLTNPNRELKERRNIIMLINKTQLEIKQNM